jgi:hypothetical protein
MNKTDLEVKIESLRNMVLESQQQTSNYTGQLATTEQQLKDYNKIALPPMVFDEIHEAVERAIDNIDFSDTGNYNVDLSMDYDNRVYIENLELTHSTDLVNEIVENISELFTEMDCPEEITEAQKADEACN